MIEIWTDGSCRGNPGPGGYGVVCPELKYYYSEKSKKDTTNNREELKALLKACRLAVRYPEESFIIYCDSSYCVNIFNSWAVNWARNGWHKTSFSYQTPNGNKIVNLDLVQKLYRYIIMDFPNFQVMKCKGHSDILGNELADALAKGDKERFKQICEDNNVDFDLKRKI